MITDCIDNEIDIDEDDIVYKESSEKTHVSKNIEHSIVVKKEDANIRLDKFITDNCNIPGISRMRIQSLLESNNILVNGEQARASLKLKGGEFISIDLPIMEPSNITPENIPIDIIYEDPYIAVINKQQGLSIHPATTIHKNTLVNALLYHIKDLSGIGGKERPGIVHRIDKDTSGVIVVAKNDLSHQKLSEQFKLHTIKRQYIALVKGRPYPFSGTWESSIARDPHNRLKMKSTQYGGKKAITHYKVAEVFSNTNLSLLELTLETGRTHQIRVHASEQGFPIIGDPIYSPNWQRGIKADSILKQAFSGLNRQLLHAKTLGFNHPASDSYVEFKSDIPNDFQLMLSVLRSN